MLICPIKGGDDNFDHLVMVYLPSFSIIKVAIFFPL